MPVASGRPSLLCGGCGTSSTGIPRRGTCWGSRRGPTAHWHHAHSAVLSLDPRCSVFPSAFDSARAPFVTAPGLEGARSRGTIREDSNTPAQRFCSGWASRAGSSRGWPWAWHTKLHCAQGHGIQLPWAHGPARAGGSAACCVQCCCQASHLLRSAVEGWGSRPQIHHDSNNVETGNAHLVNGGTSTPSRAWTQPRSCRESGARQCCACWGGHAMGVRPRLLHTNKRKAKTALDRIRAPIVCDCIKRANIAPSVPFPGAGQQCRGRRHQSGKGAPNTL